MEQDPNLTSGQRATFENELAADIVSYATSGTPTCLTAQFAKVQSWARANHINTGEILVGEYGVAQPSHNTFGDPLPTADKSGLACHGSNGSASNGLCGGGLGSGQRLWDHLW